MVIGSSAIKYHFSDFPRNPKDLDWIDSGKRIPDTNLRVEILTNPIIVDLYKNKSQIVVDSDVLYTLKISHLLGWDVNWEKHIWDVQWLKEKGCKIIKPLLYDFYDYWNVVCGENKRSNLDMSSEEFFDNAIEYPISHDTLHDYLVEHPYFNSKQPTYKKILCDNAEVLVDEEKWLKLSENDKYNLVYEEVMVMSFERMRNLYYKASYSRMLKKFVLSHAPLWEAVWIIENHKELINCPFNHIKHLENYEI